MPQSQTIAQATGCSRMLSHYCGCMVALHRVEKHLVQVQVTGPLTTTQVYHSS